MGRSGGSDFGGRSLEFRLCGDESAGGALLCGRDTARPIASGYQLPLE